MISSVFTHVLWSCVVLAIMLSCEHDTGTVKIEHKVLCFIPILNSIWLIALIITRGFEFDTLALKMFKTITNIKDFLIS